MRLSTKFQACQARTRRRTTAWTVLTTSEPTTTATTSCTTPTHACTGHSYRSSSWTHSTNTLSMMVGVTS